MTKGKDVQAGTIAGRVIQCLPSSASGGMYTIVPGTLERVRANCPGWKSTIRELPRSLTLATMAELSKTFFAKRSLWIKKKVKELITSKPPKGWSPKLGGGVKTTLPVDDRTRSAAVKVDQPPYYVRQYRHLDAEGDVGRVLEYVIQARQQSLHHKDGKEGVFHEGQT